MLKLLLSFCLLILSLPTLAQEKPADERVQGTVETRIPLTPFMERYMLDELKALRTEMAKFQVKVTNDIVEKELNVADKAINYASVTVTYFFYLLAGAASVLAIVGWQSLRELKKTARDYAETEMRKITSTYEHKLKQIERELQRKTKVIAENYREIERFQEIHGLWLRASQEQSPQAKIDIYDQILDIKPGDLDAMTHKADAALMMNERQWALSLCNRVLQVDQQNAHALYQRACAHAGVGHEEQALSDLELAVQNNVHLRDVAAEDEEFEPLRQHPRFIELTSDGTDQNADEADHHGTKMS
ncbi:tetratricopeptide repeat protein [Oceanisphaera ostreae]|uniref:Tetratricopeptide repeat protein n=1 Tax=Oceanisphaera ostreae TaxID=914151 RepID=A0ABW3KKN4_9GAMM